jgi:NADH-quinone oxidoreductase subunit C
MSVVNNNYLLKELQDKFPNEILEVSEPYGMLTLVVETHAIIDIVAFLKAHNTIQMNFLTDVCGIHFPDQTGKELGTIYHLYVVLEN